MYSYNILEVEKGQSSRRGKSSSLGLGRSGVVKTTEVPGSDWSYNPPATLGPQRLSTQAHSKKPRVGNGAGPEANTELPGSSRRCSTGTHFRPAGTLVAVNSVCLKIPRVLVGTGLAGPSILVAFG